jgi:hypothetical protein
MDLTTWMVFTYGPAPFTGSRKTSNAVDVIVGWQVSGDITEMSRSVVQTQRLDTDTGSRTAEVQVLQVSKRWRATGPCERLYVGWAGWAELKLNIGNYCCASCICANKGGRRVPQHFYASVLEDETSEQLARLLQASVNCWILQIARPYVMFLEMVQGPLRSHWVFHTEAPSLVLQARTQA